MKKRNKNSAKPLIQRIPLLSDEDLFDELRKIVNEARNFTLYNRELARAIGDECRKRGMIKPRTFLE